MPNAIKYNVSAETLALKKGNFWIGTGDVGKGPTSSTGYYNGSTPPCVQSLTTSEGPYTYNEILDILATPEWTDPNPPMGRI